MAAVPTFDVLTTSTGLSFSHAAASSGVTLAVVGISTEDGSGLSATYGGQAMTQEVLAGPVGLLYQWVWSLVLPPQGTQTVAINGHSALSRLVVVQTYKRTRSNSPFRAAWSSVGGTGTGTISRDITAIDGDLVIDFLSCISVGAGAAQTVGAGQTERLDLSAGGGGGSKGGGQSEEGGAGTVTMSWTMDTASANYILAAVAIKLALGGSQVITVWFQCQQKFLQDLKRGLIPPDLLRRRYQEVYAI